MSIQTQGHPDMFLSESTGRFVTKFHILSKPKNGQLANSAGPDQTPQNAPSDQGLHC